MDQATTNDKLRIVLLVIFRHLVYAFGNDPPSTPFDYKSLLVSSLRPTLNTATIKVVFFFVFDIYIYIYMFHCDLDCKIFITINCCHGLSWLFTIRRPYIFN